MRTLIAYVSFGCAFVFGCATDELTADDSGRYATSVVSFTEGAGAGYGQSGYPQNVLGPPKGGTPTQGSLDVLSLGVAGSIVLEFADPIIDLPGTDFIVFENAFFFGGDQVFTEPGFVEVSSDGENFAPFPCAPESTTPQSCAGLTPRLGDDPNWDPDVVGGDAFDLAAIGFTDAVYFVRITDAGLGQAVAPTAGFDLDAVVGLRQRAQ